MVFSFTCFIRRRRIFSVPGRDDPAARETKIRRCRGRILWKTPAVIPIYPSVMPTSLFLTARRFIFAVKNVWMHTGPRGDVDRGRACKPRLVDGVKGRNENKIPYREAPPCTGELHQAYPDSQPGVRGASPLVFP